MTDPTPSTIAHCPPRNGFGITVLVLALAGLVFGLVPLTGFLALILGMLAVLFGLLGWARANRGEVTNHTIGLGGRHTAVTAALLFVSALGILSAQPAFAAAKIGPVSIKSVYVTDTEHKPKTTFEPGDGVAFHVDVENTTQEPFPIDVRFELIDNENWWSGNYSYDYTQHLDIMPVGLSRFYNPTTIPTNAYNGRYSVRVSITPTNSASPSDDGDWGEGDFRIFSTTNVNPINKQIKTLQNGAMCAGDIVSLGADSLLLKSVQTGTSATGFFEDRQSGNTYWAYVKLIPGSSCVELIVSNLNHS